MKHRELMKKTTDDRHIKIVRKGKETRKCREIKLLKKASSQTTNKVNSPPRYLSESSLIRVVNKRVNKHLSSGKHRAVIKELVCKVKLTLPSAKKLILSSGATLNSWAALNTRTCLLKIY